MKTTWFTLITLLLALTAVGAEPAAVLQPGLFELKPKTDDKAAVPAPEQIAVLKTRDGFALVTKAAAAKWKLLGTTKGAGEVKPAAGDATKPAGTLTISDLKSDGTFDLVLHQGEKAVAFAASFTTVGGLYHCAHNPSHLADGLAQMRELTKQYGCTHWTAESSSVAPAIKLEAVANLEGAPPG